ncbi:hypothetical protein M885DRAFT_550763 [Pelagophyceae sp. CCMP2097]|nr:hypothetical protein M885DRAFT_550763 [Pelagophyceae sp. CCMP2097]|mmetsp:Transcript_5818/g.18491  ORF Transcript_5818/g.18491 Transcript_5818/m.18491 type:complete len:1323 (+) Transcript_5818:52-4020(+)
MKPKLLWTDPGLPPRGPEKIKATVYAIAFKPDGTQMVVAVSSLVLVYQTIDGDLVHRLRGHKDTVYSVDYSRDGQRFASGGADKTVIIWNHKGDGILKFTHNESIQVVAYNPTTEQLASCTATDFGMWSKEQKSVTKHKVYSKILCARWNNDGQYLALGMYNGQVQIREKGGAEYKVIEKNAPVWCLAWSPARDDPCDVVAVGCWNQTVSFYQLSGAQYLKEKRVHFYPCSLAYFAGGEYMVIGGSDCRASLCTREAVRLCNVADADEWVWSLGVRPRQPAVAVGSYGGSIQMWDIKFEAVYAIESERFAVREHMTDVVVHHMRAEKRVRIKSRDYVQNVAIYKDRLAIQLPDRINVYERHRRDDHGIDMHYKLRKERIYLPKKPVPPSRRPAVAGSEGGGVVQAGPGDEVAAAPKAFLGATADHVVLAEGRKIQLFAFSEPKEGSVPSAHRRPEREWVVDAVVTAFKVDGGPAGKEGLLVGLEDGCVLKIYIDNAFPLELARTSSAVRVVAMSRDRDQLAVINDRQTLMVYGGMATQRGAQLPEFTAENASAVAFNDEFDNMFCFSQADSKEQFVRTGPDLPLQQHSIPGQVVGFVGAKLFVVNGGGVEVVDLPQSAALTQLVEARQFREAYKIACLGVTAADWRRLADAAAKSLDFETARASYMRVHDLRQIELLNSMELRRKQSKALDHQSGTKAGAKAAPRAAPGGSRRSRVGDAPAEDTAVGKDAPELEPIFQAELLAYSGKYQEAAKVYARAGRVELAIDLFADLRQWEEAKLFAASSDTVDLRDLVRRQAEWAEEVEDWSGAAAMYVAAGDAARACKLLGDHQDSDGWADQLAGIARQLDLAGPHKDDLRLCAKIFAGAGRDDLAREVLLKLGDVAALMQLYVREQQWDLAMALSQAHEGQFDKALFLPYAEWLALHDKFDEALDAYRRSGRPDMARKMMEQLTFNAVVESRFNDAAYYYWLLATEMLRTASEAGGADAVRAALPTYQDYLHKADLYYAYFHIESYFLPFSELRPDVLFQCARFVVNALGANEAPHGISRVKVLYTLAKQSKHLGAFKLARFAYEKLGSMKVPEAWADDLDLDMLAIHSKPVRDNAELLPVCYRCGATNALLNPVMQHASAGPYAERAHCDMCTSCGHPFIRSFLNFEILPLIEFLPEAGLTDDEAKELVREAPPDRGLPGRIGGSAGRWNERAVGGADVMGMGDDDEEGDDDLFGKCINRTLSMQEGANAYMSVTADARTLRSLRREDVYVCSPKFPGMRATFYKAAIADVHMAISQPCHRFFHEEDFEFQLLRDGKCPYSRFKQADIGDFGPC